ncbi:MAG: ABC transporter permease [Microbacteriaceae bacterium]|nr:ABC transporter permease [Microbacteriaceae bacterium]
MKSLDVISTAIGNTFRSKLRTTLTVIAIFIGAFTLTITSGIGTGVNGYIDTTVAAIGAKDVLTVTKTANAPTTGPTKYDPNTISAGARARPGSTIEAMNSADIATIRAVSGVLSVQPILGVRPSYIEGTAGTKYSITSNGAGTGVKLQLQDGAQPSITSTGYEVALPVSYVKALGLKTDAAAIGSTVRIGITDSAQNMNVVEATVVGVATTSLGGAGDSVTTNPALTQKLYDVQSTGLAGVAKDRFAQATVTFNAAATDKEISQLKDRLAKDGFTAVTVADQIGTFKTVIDVIVLILNAFAVIALVAAGFGIVNTLLMSVQERTREIGLMKAMGMGSGKIFGLFSFEAIFIGFLGSALGAAIGIAVGSGISAALSRTVFSALPGLTLISFNAGSIAGIIAIVMAIAFVAGSLPATRAARQDPIESLRYE